MVWTAGITGSLNNLPTGLSTVFVEMWLTVERTTRNAKSLEPTIKELVHKYLDRQVISEAKVRALTSVVRLAHHPE
jgi:hypothetical protein